jgi:hypothetical protein
MIMSGGSGFYAGEDVTPYLDMEAYNEPCAYEETGECGACEDCWFVCKCGWTGPPWKTPFIWKYPKNPMTEEEVMDGGNCWEEYSCPKCKKILE